LNPFSEYSRPSKLYFQFTRARFSPDAGIAMRTVSRQHPLSTSLDYFLYRSAHLMLYELICLYNNIFESKEKLQMYDDGTGREKETTERS
jgi:hypothetical protein